MKLHIIQIIDVEIFTSVRISISLGENIEIPKCSRRVKLFALQINQLAGKLTDPLATVGPCIAY